MTIRIEVTNPAEHQPSELRAVGQFLFNLAEDRAAGRIAETPAYRAVGEVSIGQHEAPTVVTAGPTGSIPALPPVTTDAPGASIPSETEQDAGAPDASDTSKADVNGVMWDDRIHSETKSQNKDGSWRQKRGVDPELVKAVLAEQKGAPAGGTHSPEVPAATEQQTPPPVPTAVEQQQTPPPVPTATDAPTVKPADVIRFITSNKLDAAMVNEVLAAMGTGLTKAADLFAKADQAPAALESLQALVS